MRMNLAMAYFDLKQGANTLSRGGEKKVRALHGIKIDS